jgi:hypothetical protein
MNQSRRDGRNDPGLALFCLALVAAAPSPREAALAFALRLLARRASQT